jgi:Fic family protein
MYVPPPPHALDAALGEFEKYLHGEDALHPLVRAGLLHVQVETIHPYLDGNGRIGRLLVTLLLEHWKLLTEPLLYLSLFFKRHREQYYRRLDAVRVDGDWEGRIDFFLDGVATIADEAVATARELFALIAEDRARVPSRTGPIWIASKWARSLLARRCRGSDEAAPLPRDLPPSSKAATESAEKNARHVK